MTPTLVAERVDPTVVDVADSVLALQGLDEEIESDITDMFGSGTSFALCCTC